MQILEENKVISFCSNWTHPDNMPAVRGEAKRALALMDFPNSKIEQWKYTRTNRITNKTYRQSKGNSTVLPLQAEINDHLIVFENGFLNKDLSKIYPDACLEIVPIEEFEESNYLEYLEDIEENVFSLINKAFSTCGCYIKVSKNLKSNRNVHLVHLINGEGIVSNVRHFIELEKGAELNLISSFHSNNTKQSFNNVVFEGILGENACLKIDKIQNEDKEQVYHISTENFIQQASSNLKINSVTLGVLLVKNMLNILVEGVNCSTELNGVFLGKQKQLIDNHTFIDHMASNCNSKETYKGIMDDQSIGVFNGKVIVRKDAQKIEAYQSNGNILLTDFSSVNSKPELEIYANDVKCSHGSTTGQLDEHAIYYLQTRGINRSKAEKMIAQAYVLEVINEIEMEFSKNYLKTIFQKDFKWEF